MGEDRPSYCALTSENVVESGGKQVTHMGTRMVYKIVVRGELSERYAMAFEGIEMEIENGQTVLTGEVKDQSHLHGILERIGASGLKLVSVELDFSHLSQSGWVAHRPSAQREAISRWLHTPLFAISATKPQAELRKGLLRGF